MALLVDEDRLSAAYEVLKDAAPHSGRRMEYISKNIWSLLAAASNYAHRNQQTDNMAAQMLDALVKKGYCQHTNKHLSVVIKEYLDKKEIHQAVKQFAAFAEAHKELPQLLTLLTTLIRLANDEDGADERPTGYGIETEQALEYIDSLVDVALTVRSVASVNANILMAFACAGREAQVRKILLNPDVELSSQQLAGSVEFLTKRGQIDGVVVLTRATQGITRAELDKQSVYESLLGHYEVKNDFEAAVRLFKRLYADDRSNVSGSFARRLKALLQQNQQKIPVELVNL